MRKLLSLLPFVFLVTLVRSQTVQELIHEIVTEKMHTNSVFQEAEGSVVTSIAEHETKLTTSESPESEIHVVVNPTDSNNIVMCAMRLVRNPGFTVTEFPIYYTKDHGVTWKGSSFTPMPQRDSFDIRGGGDPVMAFDKNGRLYLTWIHIYKPKGTFDTIFWGMFWAFSDNGGENWIQPKNDTIGFGIGVPYTSNFTTIRKVYDKQWVAIDNSGSKYQNNLYLVCLKADLDQNKYHIIFKKKDALNNHFEAKEVDLSGSIPSVQFASIDIDDNGVIHVIFVSNKKTIWYCSSKNGGSSFSLPKQIVNFELPYKIEGIKYGNSERLYPANQIVIDKWHSSNYKNSIYITYTATNNSFNIDSARANIYLIKSEDGGDNWSNPVLVSKEDKLKPRDQFYSSMTVGENGELVLGYYDASKSDSLQQNDRVNYVVVKSTDGGNSFSDPLAVSSLGSNFQHVGIQNNGFGIGEYTQTVISGNTIFPVWSDGRSNDGKLKVYVAKINLITFSSVQEISFLDNRIENVNLFPNPVSDNLYLSMRILEPTEFKLCILDAFGKKLKSIPSKQMLDGYQKIEIPIDNLPQSVYFVRIETDFGYFLKRFIIAN